MCFDNYIKCGSVREVPVMDGHTAPHGYITLRSEGGTSLWEWEHNNKVPVKAEKADSLT